MDFVTKNARLSFPNLFTPSAYEGSDNLKYSATLILDKTQDADQIAQLRKIVSSLAKEKWSDKLPKKMFYSLQDGDDLERAEYEGKYILKANNKKRVPIIDKDMSALVAEDERPYAGCFVNAKVRFYAWSNGGSFSGVLCSLEAVQFAADGESFGGGAGNALDGFEDLNGATADDVASEQEEEFLA